LVADKLARKGGDMRQARRGRQALAGLVLVAWCAAASAFSIGLKPTPASYQLGDPFTLDLVVEGLSVDNEILSTYDIDIGFASAYFTYQGASSSGALGPGSFFSDLFIDVLGVGTVNLFEFPDALTTDADLSASQGDPLTLARLTFVGNTVGGPFDFTLFAHSLGGSQVTDPQNPNGPTITAELTASALNPAVVTITERTTNVPEPASWALLALGLLLLTLRVRRPSLNS